MKFNNLNEMFDMIYCINLKKDTYRWSVMSNIFKKLNLNVKQIIAEDSSYNNVKKIFNSLNKNNPMKIKNQAGAIGCMLSHTTAINHAKKNNFKKILILEDDIIPCKDFLNYFKTIEFPKEYKLLYLGNNRADLFQYSKKYNDNFDNSTKVNGTFCYAIDSSIFDEILSLINTFANPIDTLLHNISEKYKNLSFVLNKPLFFPNILTSNIRSKYHTSYYDMYNRMKFDIKDFDLLVLEENKNIIIGLGTGRCGTKSLEKLLNLQKNSFVSHELHEKFPMPPWNFDEDLISFKMLEILTRKEENIGDIGMYYLPYIEWLNSNFKNINFIALKRDKDSVIKSFVKKISRPLPNGRNHFKIHDGKFWKLDNLWDPQFPKFQKETLEECISEYYDYYYQQINLLNNINIKVFNTLSLNNEKDVNDILDHVKIKNKKIILNIKENTWRE